MTENLKENEPSPIERSVTDAIQRWFDEGAPMPPDPDAPTML